MTLFPWMVPHVNFLLALMDCLKKAKKKKTTTEHYVWWAWDWESERAKGIWMAVYFCILHACLSTRTTRHLAMRRGIWCLSAHRCGVCSERSGVGSEGCVCVSVCKIEELSWALNFPHLPLHLENLSHWLLEVTVLPGPHLPICFCVYVFVCVCM